MHQGAWKSNQTVNSTEESCGERVKFLSCTAVERLRHHWGWTENRTNDQGGHFIIRFYPNIYVTSL